MSDGFQFYDIIFFALIAIFIILRLRGVLGRRTGQHRQRHPDRFARTEQPPEESQGQTPSQGQAKSSSCRIAPGPPAKRPRMLRRKT